MIYRGKRKRGVVTKSLSMECLVLVTSSVDFLTRLPRWLMISSWTRVQNWISALKMNYLYGDKCCGLSWINCLKTRMIWHLLLPLTLQAISKYWVVFYDLVDAPLEYESWGNANGHVVHYAQHPCWFNVAIQKELHTPKTLPKVFVIMI